MSPVDDDLDMDAPQISTLRDENTPPPTRTSKFRVKLLVPDRKSPPSAAASARKSDAPSGPTPIPSDDDDDDDLEQESDEEVDQLIDDDVVARTSTPLAPNALVPAKRKAPAKKPRSRKNDKQDKEPAKLAEEPQEQADRLDGPESTTTVPERPPPKKRAPPRKAPAPPRSKAKATKPSTTLSPAVVDDTVMSETHTVTAPSSPIPNDGQEGGRSPHAVEVEQTELPNPECPPEGAPLPVYPLPSRPFPVQPPPKIGTGFAPMLSLDRSGTKVRRWRVANREIRGIAGGRWFARSWVGDRESESAAAASARPADGDRIAMPKPTTSISAPLLGKAGKAKAPRISAGMSSRSGSIVQELHSTKAPSKMRNVVARPASEAGNESDTTMLGHLMDS